MANRFWAGGTGSWSSTTKWSASAPLQFTASCTGVVLSTVGSPALVVGMTVWATNNTSLGTITSGSANTWVVSIGGSYASQQMTSATVGASVPTAVDDVTFSANSGLTAFTANLPIGTSSCRLLDLSAIAVNVTLNGLTFSATNLFVYGSYAGSATLSWAVNTGFVLRLAGNTAGLTFNGAGVQSQPNLSVEGVQGTYTMTGNWGTMNSSLPTGATVSVNGGGITTNNFGIQASSLSISNSNGSTVTGLTLGSSLILINAGGVFVSNITNYFINAGTSTLRFDVNSAGTLNFTSAGTTWATVQYFQYNSTSDPLIVDSLTCSNLTLNPNSASQNSGRLFVGASITVTGTLTITGPSAAGSSGLASSVLGTARSITAGAVSLTNAIFRDITNAGVSAWTGTRVGDCGGNTNITFSTPKTVYWNLNAGGNWSSVAWATSSGGTPNTINYPLPQDTAIIEQTGLNVGASININSYFISNIDMSARTSSVTMATGTGGGTPEFYGNITQGTGTLWSGNGSSFVFRGTKTFRSNGVTFGNANSSTQINCFGGTVQFLDNSSFTGSLINGLTLNHGTIDLNGFILTAPVISTSNSNVRSIAFGSSSINLNGNGTTVFSCATNTNFSVSGTPVINLTYSGGAGTRTVATGLVTEANSISFNITAGTDSVQVFGSQTAVRNINFTGFSGTMAAIGATSPTIYGSLTISTGMTVTASTDILTFAATSGPNNITSNGKTLDFRMTFNGVGGTWVLQDNLNLAAKALTLSNGTLDLNSKVLTAGSFVSSTSTARTLSFGSGNMTLVGTGTVFSNTSATNFSVTGDPVVNITTAGSTAVTVTAPGTEANSISFNFTGGTYALNFLNATGAAARSVNFAGFAGTWTSTATSSIFGDLTLSTGMTIATSTTTLTFGSTSATVRDITSNGKTLDRPITFNGVGGSWRLQDNMTMGQTRTTTLTNGSINLQSYTLTTGLFASSSSNVRSIAFGNGNITCNANGGTVWNTSASTNLTTTGTQVVNVTNATATATTVSSGGLSEANSISFNFTAGTYALTFLNSAGSSARDVNFTGFSGTLGANSSAIIYGDYTLSPTMTLSASATALTFGSTSATTKTITTNGKTIDFPLTFSGSGGFWRLEDALTMASTRVLTITAGTLTTNNFNITTGTFSTTGSSLRVLNIGTSTINILGSGAAWTYSGSNFSFTGNGTINLSSASSKTFAGGGLQNWPTLNNNGTGALVISGSNRFAALTNTVQPTTFTFTAGTTNFINSFAISGTAGNLVTLGSTSTSQAFLRKPTPWYMGANSVDGGNNTGLVFTAGAGVNYISASYINGAQVGAGPGNFLVFF